MNMNRALIPIGEAPDLPLPGCDGEFYRRILIAAEAPNRKGG